MHVVVAQCTSVLITLTLFHALMETWQDYVSSYLIQETVDIQNHHMLLLVLLE